MPQSYPFAQGRVGDRHHAVAPSGVVLPQVPAEGVEVGELPAEQEGTQQQSTRLQSSSGCGPAHDGWYRTHNRPHPGVGDAEALERSVAAGVQEDV